jgi:hypothetical protein
MFRLVAILPCPQPTSVCHTFFTFLWCEWSQPMCLTRELYVARKRQYAFFFLMARIVRLDYVDKNRLVADSHELSRRRDYVDKNPPRGRLARAFATVK